MAQQEVDRLWAELQRVEQKIEAKEQELREVVKAKLIASIGKERDRLVDEKKDLRHQLSALQIRLATPSGASSDAGTGIRAILRNQQILMEQQQTQAFASAHLILRLSPFEHHKAPSSAQSNPALKEELVRTYQLQQLPYKKGDPKCIRCQATGEVLLSGAVIAGHLFPRKSAEFGLEWGLVDPDNDVRNALVWFDGVEKAWSELKICLVYVGDLLRLRVLDTELLDVYVVDEAAPKNRIHATDALRAMTFRDLDNREIYFPAGVITRPYQRVVAAQAANAIIHMWKLGKLREDIDKFRLDVVSDFSAKPACLAWIRTAMVYLPSWPVGPEPEVEIDEAHPKDIEGITEAAALLQPTPFDEDPIV